MSSWNTNVLPFEPVYYCQPPHRHVQPPVGDYNHTRDVVTSVCDVMSAFLKHPLSETFIKPKSPSLVDLIPKVFENEKLMEHINGAFSAIRVAYEKPDSGVPKEHASNAPTRGVANDRKCSFVNLDSYPQRLVLTFKCAWAVDGVAILHIDPVKPAILTFAVKNPQVRIIEIESVVCCDMDVYVSHRSAKQRCFIYLDQVNEADLVDELEIRMTTLEDSELRTHVLKCKSSS